jgi:NADH-quinone oxidoreductase subunit L
MLENIWVIPAITFASFWLILLFGKKLPFKGHEIGLLAVGATLVLSVVAGAQWLDRPADYEPHATAATAEHASNDDAHADEATATTDDHATTDDAHTESTAAATETDDHGEAAEGEEEHHAEPVRKAVDNSVRWFTIGSIDVEASTHVDGLAIVMLLTVAIISFLVHLFSTNYMHDDRRYTHFFAALSLFTTGMYVLVSAGNTLQALFGWELMGLCSFMLIGHWWEEQGNSDAALKAFFTTRTGDIGLLVGISVLFFEAGGTFDIAKTNELALGGGMSHTVLLVAGSALLAAIIGKSAQFPLHTWLPDAMAGPTPVSALIHAATMVVAGVYLLTRLYGVFWEAFSISAGGVNAVALVGGATILIAAALAFVQRDIKKVLAYSTVSQLGYMVLALGVGAWTAAIFHFFTHAFFKALLFLGSGSVSHAVHSFDMKDDMGGLRKYMPKTFATFMIGSVALAGIPPLAGFWSKDEILLGAGENGYGLFLVVGSIGAFLTAAYMTRCVYLTFFGEYRGHGHPHESPWPITVPLMVLAVLSVFAGFLNAPFADYWFTDLTNNEMTFLAELPHHTFDIGTAAISTVIALAGIALGAVLYFGGRLPKGVTERNKAAHAGYALLANRYYLDHVYTGGVVGGIKGPIARAAYWFNQNVLDGVVNGVAKIIRIAGTFIYKYIDQGAIDGAVNGSGAGAESLGQAFRRLQTGRVQQYGSLLFGATALLALALVVFVR